jgi:hypothetical protein
MKWISLVLLAVILVAPFLAVSDKKLTAPTQRKYKKLRACETESESLYVFLLIHALKVIKQHLDRTAVVYVLNVAI